MPRSPRLWTALACATSLASAAALAAGILTRSTGGPGEAATGRSQTPAAALEASLASAYARLPLAFEPTRNGAAFLARGTGAGILLRAQGASFALSAPKPRFGTALRMELTGARPAARLSPSKRLPGIVNEFYGSDPSKWRTNIPTFARLEAAEVYPGIAVAYHGRQGMLEYDFLLSPGADAGRIALRFSGQRRLRLDRHGDLLLSLPGGTLRRERPRAFQDGRPVPARFVLRQGRVGFALGRHDRSRPLLIDPSVAYSTYLGGSSIDVGYGIAVDSAGSAYLTGETWSPNFPTASPFQAANGVGPNDAFVAKLNPAGSALTYASYLGGSGFDVGAGIAVDSAGSAYLIGSTGSVNFPVASPFQATNGGGPSDAFVAKLHPAGSALTYASYLGGSNEDIGLDIAVDSADGAYLTGQTSSVNFPTASPFQATNGGGSDAFVVKLAVNVLAYSSYLGGSGIDAGHAIAVDSAGSAYLTGHTASSNFPTASPFQAANAGGASDAFVAKLNPGGSAFTYASYLGGSGSDLGRGIAVDSAGNAYLTGDTGSVNFPTASPFQAANAGGVGDAFVAKLNPAGSALAYSSYLGGSSDDAGYAIAVDSAASAYLTGHTASSNFPTVSPFQATIGSAVGNDAFVAKLNPAGSALTYSSYLGGSNEDFGYGIAVDSAGNAYLIGDTGSVNFPTASPFQAASGGGGADAFVTKVDAAATAVLLRSFQARREGRRVTLHWRTGTEAGLLGFDLYRGKRRLNRVVLRARFPQGGSYTFRDALPREVATASYRLELVRLDGTRLRQGPARVR